MIGDYGSAVNVYPDGKVDPAHNSEMEVRMTHGSFRLSIAALDKAFVKATSHEPIYPTTCTDLISVTGTTPVVADPAPAPTAGSAATSRSPSP